MKDWGELIGALIPIIVVILLVFVAYSVNVNQWNDGYCSCGGKWVYQEAVGHGYNTTYIYKCDKCGKVKEFYLLHEETQK